MVRGLSFWALKNQPPRYFYLNGLSLDKPKALHNRDTKVLFFLRPTSSLCHLFCRRHGWAGAGTKHQLFRELLQLEGRELVIPPNMRFFRHHLDDADDIKKKCHIHWHRWSGNKPQKWKFGRWFLGSHVNFHGVIELDPIFAPASP